MLGSSNRTKIVSNGYRVSDANCSQSIPFCFIVEMCFRKSFTYQWRGIRRVGKHVTRKPEYDERTSNDYS
jgi:hypothetical protein